MKYVWHLLVFVAILGVIFALSRSVMGLFTLAGLAGALTGSLASVYGQLGPFDGNVDAERRRNPRRH